MKRIEFTTKIKLAAWVRSRARCDECTARLNSAEYDHRVPRAMGGESTLANCMVLCRTCHALKTTTQDIPRIAKSKRIEAKHRGAKRGPKQKIQSRGFRRTESNTKQTSVRF